MSRSAFKLLVVLIGGFLLGAASFSVWTVGRSSPEPAPLVLATTTTRVVTTTLPPVTTLAPTTTTTAPPPTTTTLPPKGTLLIQGVGDVALDPDYIPVFRSEGYDYAFSGLEGLFLEDDLTVVNLECTPSDLGRPLIKEFTFRCPTEALPALINNGVEVANMGNNHSGDFGKEALVDGRRQLIAAGVAPVGAGKDNAEAGAPAIFEIKGWTIAVVGFGGVAPDSSWYAHDHRAGMRSGDHVDQMVEAVEAAAQVADIVIVTIHWGFELETEPNPGDRERAEAMIAAGADIIFGHHQHRLNPLEIVDGAAVFWGLGNFIWPRISVPSATTAVARVVIYPDGTIEACMIPAFIETHGRPVITGEAECGPPV